MTSPLNISKNLKTILQTIDNKALEVGRKEGEVNLIAVSKVKPAEVIVQALQAGQRIFGENRVQESLEKWPNFKAQFEDVELHLIGPLQTNKVKEALPLFDVIETVDRPKLARFLAREMDATGHRLDCLIQVNTGEEPQKAGVLPDDLDDFVKSCLEEYQLPIKGLMCIPPVGEEPALHFALLREMARRNGLQTLSMGMSGDFETAIELGATHVRVGSAIFGERPPFKPA
ncbi:MAG: YggS family pyridoxal phosphate-dependent enzyme [Alphaproteobacteria bacterium]|nr:YggS family pyridoxal phosphate-dependent enzyme [Alphaproteobacteria bacterium]